MPAPEVVEDLPTLRDVTLPKRHDNSHEVNTKQDVCHVSGTDFEKYSHEQRDKEMFIM
jgi:hypothetical protein